MRYCLLMLSFVFSLGACAQEAPATSGGEKYIEGTHYQKMSAPVPTIVPQDKIEITEIFRFGCPACFKFEDVYQVWSKSKPEYIEFVKNPVVWDKTTKIHAQVYFTGKALGLDHEISQAVFEAIHVNAKTRNQMMTAMTNEDDIIAAFVALGADQDKAEKIYKSFSIKSSVNRADARARSFAISGTPEIFVDGRYRVTTETAGSFQNMLTIAAYLAEKAAKEKGLL
jgi:thiol:disulfide interchange protein DsbA